MHTIISTLKTKWFILRTCVEERLVYRADFAFATLIRFLPIVTQIYLWGAIFQASQQATGATTLNSYSYGDMVAYFLLVMISRAFSSMPGLTTGIARDVRDGTIKKFLLQPVDLLDWLFWHRIAHKLVFYTVAIGPYALIFWLCRGFFPGWPDGLTWAGGIAALVLSFLIGFLIESWLGLVAFWFLEVSSLVFIYMLMNYFLSGHMLPLDWLPGPVSQAIQILPFKYLAYVPAAIFLQKYTPAELGWELAGAVAWVIALFLLNRWTLARGVRRYSAYGG